MSKRIKKFVDKVSGCRSRSEETPRRNIFDDLGVINLNCNMLNSIIADANYHQSCQNLITLHIHLMLIGCPKPATSKMFTPSHSILKIESNVKR